MAAGNIKLQAADLKIAEIKFEDGAASNVNVVVPKEGGTLFTSNNFSATASGIANVPSGSIAGTTVQAALNELDTEKASASHNHTLANITDFPTAVSATELGYLDGVTSSIQTQIGTKIGATDYANSTTGGTVKVRLNGTIAYIRSDGTNA